MVRATKLPDRLSIIHGRRALHISLAIMAGLLLVLPPFRLLEPARAAVSAGDLVFSTTIFSEGYYDTIAQRTSDGTAHDLSHSALYGTQDIDPEVSADGRKIAFVRQGGDLPGIYIMNSDGSGQQRVTDNVTLPSGVLALADHHPSWSPDSSQLVFWRYLAFGGDSIGFQVYKVGADGNNLCNISIGTGCSASSYGSSFDGSPEWSPDGTKIAFARDTSTSWSDNMQLYTMNTDGSSQAAVRSSATGTDDDDPAWSPNGATLYYDRWISGNNAVAHIYKMASNGSGSISGVSDDSTTGLQDLNPRVSPDGSTITFWSTRLGTPAAAVYTVSSSGGTLTNVTDYDSHWPTYVPSAFPTSSAKNLVALGDSVAAGEGINYGWVWDSSSGSWTKTGPDNPTWTDTTAAYGSDIQRCHQSDQAYDRLFYADNYHVLNMACTGASAMYPSFDYPPGGVLVKEKFYDPDTHDLVQTAPKPQLGSSSVSGADSPNSAYDSAEPDVVTLTLGADDINFGYWLTKCFDVSWFNDDNNLFPPACNNTDNTGAVNSLLGNAKTDLHKVLQEIYDRGAANGKIPHVYLTGYYDAFPATYNSSCSDIVLPQTGLNGGLTSDEITWLRDKLSTLNSNISDEASQFSNVTYVNLSGVMSGHEFCSSDPWVYGASIARPADTRHNPAPYHPTPAGQRAIYQAIKNAMPGSKADYVTNGTFESGSATGWNATNTPAVTTAQAHGGTHSMTFTGSFDVTDSPNFITTQAVDIDPADFWAKGPAGKTVRVKFRQYLTGGNNELYQSFTLSGGWDHFVSNALHLYPGYALDFNIDNPGAGSSDVFYLDDIHEYGYVATESCGYQNLLNGFNADAVENCGGEAPYGTQYWVAADSANPTLTSDTSDSHDGLYSFKLVAANSGTMSMNDSPDARDVGEVSGSATSCTATAWLKGPTGGSRSLKLRIREYNANQGGLKGTDTATATPNGSWQQLSITRTLASGHDSNTHLDLYAYMTNASANDVVRVDHVTETCQ